VELGSNKWAIFNRGDKVRAVGAPRNNRWLPVKSILVRLPLSHAKGMHEVKSFISEAGKDL
jgi:hypothetical protein